MLNLPFALRAASVGLTVASSTLVATPALAAPSKPTSGMQVLDLVADFDQRTAAQRLTGALQQRFDEDGRFAVATKTVALLPLAKYVVCDFSSFNPRVLRQDADRTVDDRCLRSVAAKLSATRLVWGFVYTTPDGKRWAKVRLWQEGQPERVKALPYEEGASGLERVAERFYLHLARPEEAADVKLSAPSSTGEADLWVDGKGQGPFAPGIELTLRAGEHAFEARREGKAVAQARATAVAGKTTDVQLAAVFMPRTDIDPTEGYRPPPPVVVTPHGTWKRPAGFVGLGLGAVALGVGIFSSLRVRGLNDDFDNEQPFVAYRSAPGRTGDSACDAAERGFESTVAGAASPSQVRDLCSERSTFRTLQFVGYGGAALFGGVGAYLLLTAPKAQSTVVGRGPSWRLTPSAGPSSAGATFHLRFLPSTFRAYVVKELRA